MNKKALPKGVIVIVAAFALSVSYVYSNYHHPNNWHRASVVRGVNDSTVFRSGDAQAGVWAKIEKTVAGLSGRKSFYYKYTY